MVNTFAGKTIHLFVLIAFLFSTSCTSTKLLEVQTESLQSELKKGDILEITTVDGKDFKFRITEISSESIIGKTELGENQQILFTEIAKIEKTQPKPSITFALTLEALQNELRSGDTVKITTKDGNDFKFEVAEISSEAILGVNQQILFTEIAKIEKRQSDPSGTIAVLVIPIACALVISLKALETAGD